MQKLALTRTARRRDGAVLVSSCQRLNVFTPRTPTGIGLHSAMAGRPWFAYRVGRRAGEVVVSTHSAETGAVVRKTQSPWAGTSRR